MKQTALQFRTRGGRRHGTGRKPISERAGVPHHRRPIHESRHPARVTVRVVRGLPSLRCRKMFPVVRRGLTAPSNGAFRIVHFSVQSNHIHLLVEADGTRTLGRGMQGLGIRLAKTINRRLGRARRVWMDRYHCRALGTPREVRNALIYVLLNGRKHGLSGPGLDPCSSGSAFAGWRAEAGPSSELPPVARPRTWLLSVGWRRAGAIGFRDAPASPRLRPRSPACRL